MVVSMVVGACTSKIHRILSAFYDYGLKEDNHGTDKLCDVNEHCCHKPLHHTIPHNTTSQHKTQHNTKQHHSTPQHSRHLQTCTSASCSELIASLCDRCTNLWPTKCKVHTIYGQRGWGWLDWGLLGCPHTQRAGFSMISVSKRGKTIEVNGGFYGCGCLYEQNS